jgi:hypothetical protein
MTPDQERRKKEFDQLFESIPGKNIDRVRRVCQILHYQPNTIRILRMANPPRVIPERMLAILRKELGRSS